MSATSAIGVDVTVGLWKERFCGHLPGGYLLRLMVSGLDRWADEAKRV